MLKNHTKLVSEEEAQHYLNTLDLTYLAEFMCASYYPLPRWTWTDASYCLQLYKNFLFLQKKYLPESLVPTREIDECWHNHILYTQNYFHDCEKIFGHYLHHNPASPTENKEKLVQDFLRTKELYFKEYNQALTVPIRGL